MCSEIIATPHVVQPLRQFPFEFTAHATRNQPTALAVPAIPAHQRCWAARHVPTARQTWSSVPHSYSSNKTGVPAPEGERVSVAVVVVAATAALRVRHSEPAGRCALPPVDKHGQH